MHQGLPSRVQMGNDQVPVPTYRAIDPDSSLDPRSRRDPAVTLPSYAGSVSQPLLWGGRTAGHSQQGQLQAQQKKSRRLHQMDMWRPLSRSMVTGISAS